MVMTEFIGNETELVVDIDATLEPEDDGAGGVMLYLGLRVENESGVVRDEWITDDPDAIDQWFADQAVLAEQWREHYHGIKPIGGHFVPLGPGNSGAGAR